MLSCCLTKLIFIISFLETSVVSFQGQGINFGGGDDGKCYNVRFSQLQPQIHNRNSSWILIYNVWIELFFFCRALNRMGSGGSTTIWRGWVFIDSTKPWPLGSLPRTTRINWALVQSGWPWRESTMIRPFCQEENSNSLLLTLEGKGHPKVLLLERNFKTPEAYLRFLRLYDPFEIFSKLFYNDIDPCHAGECQRSFLSFTSFQRPSQSCFPFFSVLIWNWRPFQSV